jgi:hypothetical protein
VIPSVFFKDFEQAIDSIIKKKNQRKVTEEIIEKLKSHGFPPSLNKGIIVDGLSKIINEELPFDSSRVLTEMITFSKAVPIKLTNHQRSNLKKIMECILETPTDTSCNHDSLVISISIHGGGFTPVIRLPEVICLYCGLNVTLYSKETEKYGIEISDKKMKELFKWAMENRGKFAEDFVKDPIGSYNSCESKWEGDIPFRITNMKAFESRSGQ